MMTASASMGSITPWKQNTEGDMYQVYKPRSSPKPRPASSSPRYVRTWSQEEEAYLLEARRARVPYKDIASKLNKTDLACRLHYHQMVVARKSSASEDSNVLAPPVEQYNPAMQYQHRSDSLPPITTAMSPQMLLPAPMMRESSRNGSGAATINPNHRRTPSQPQTPGRRQSSPSPPLGGVSKYSPVTQHMRRPQVNCAVDLGRIQELYKDFAPGFWSNIAAAYSGDKSLSPSDVEMAFFHGQGLGLTGSEPITPNSSVGTSPLTSWPSTGSTASSSIDERVYSPTEHSSDRGHGYTKELQQDYDFHDTSLSLRSTDSLQNPLDPDGPDDRSVD